MVSDETKMILGDQSVILSFRIKNKELFDLLDEGKEIETEFKGIKLLLKRKEDWENGNTWIGRLEEKRKTKGSKV